MPFFRQLWTVETGALSKRATEVVPPSASIILAASVCMNAICDIRRLQARAKSAIIAVALNEPIVTKGACRQNGYEQN